MKKLFTAILFVAGAFMISNRASAQRWGNNDHGNKDHHKQEFRQQGNRGNDHYDRGDWDNGNRKMLRGDRNNYSYGYAPRSAYRGRPMLDRGYRGGRPMLDRGYRGRPYWAGAHHYRFNRHVYFPDYRMFYDARRNGYVYMDGGRWLFSPYLPSFMASVNLGAARIEYMSGIPLTALPQDYYGTYYRSYPPSLNINLNF